MSPWFIMDKHYIHEIGYTQCLRMFQDGTFALGAGNVIHGLRANQTSFHSLTLAGRRVMTEIAETLNTLTLRELGTML
ncbi:leucyl phenylalanyl-trna--protein transferase [Lasius niger]|uniref:Leucyl phenylalanyl-trna--protein transferase n=1 Tax=Lasius niger TaxID=67767 RepID=A0A0J7K2G7_LASNI|nr:leucyl phenylalanyl-trna--protein transferase [Lasius niger]